MTRLFIIRHGETEWNSMKRTQGCSNDLSLNKEGLMQARMAAKVFDGISVACIYSSDLRRAFETAEEISEIVRCPVIKLKELREINFGCWEGLTISEIYEKYKDIYQNWRDNPLKAVIPGAETLQQLSERVLSSVYNIIEIHQKENIILISHGITIKVLITGILGMDMNMFNSIRIDNTGISVVDFKDGKFYLTLLNDTCHIKPWRNKI